jgi:hypothetical protein
MTAVNQNGNFIRSSGFSVSFEGSKYFCVVASDSWPSQTCTVRTSMPARSHLVAGSVTGAVEMPFRGVEPLQVRAQGEFPPSAIGCRYPTSRLQAAPIESQRLGHHRSRTWSLGWSQRLPATLKRPAD